MATQQSRKMRKIAAVAAGALVVGVGASFTLASWTDSEWVSGSVDGETPGVGTSDFEVQQNTSSPYADAGWTDEEENPGGALMFSAGALTLTPGDSIYAPVALQTTDESVAATVALQGAVASTGITIEDPDGALWAAIDVDVYTAAGDTPPACTPADFDAAAWTAILTGGLDDAATASQDLDAAAGSTQHYCFVLSLPDDAADDLQGRTIAPAWEFASESVEA